MGFSETVSDIVDKGITVSKKLVGQAGDAVQKFSDKSVVRLEKRQFESKRDSQIKELGRIAAAVFITDGKEELRRDDYTVSSILEEIKLCDAEIARRDAILREDIASAPKNENTDSESASAADNQNTPKKGA